MIHPAISGAIDLGGTKIEARLFDADLQSLESQRIPTPTDSYETFIEALSSQIAWLQNQANRTDLPIGICIPGVINPETGVVFASNIPVTGHNIGETLKQRFNQSFPLATDCMALAYSEANGGAGEGYSAVVGLVLGTGVGAGLVINGDMPPRHGGLAVEIGHVGMPARVLQKFDLPLSTCGCGKVGCMERYMSGSAFARLSEWKTGQAIEGPELIQRALSGDSQMLAILDMWTELAAECLFTLQLTLAPNCIVIGGGVSRMKGLSERLTTALEAISLGNAAIPEIRIAEHGDSSGARGMALLALKQTQQTTP